MSEEELEYFRGIIVQKRDEILRELGHLRDPGLDSPGKDNSAENAYSFHMADQGTDNMEREKKYFFAGREGKLLSYLEAALDRIDRKEYGICRECNEPIAKPRLEAVPHATLCVDCKTKREQQR